MSKPIIVWFRRNLRLADNAPLAAACDTGRPVVALYVSDSLDSGGASRWWLHHSLESLAANLGKYGISLVLRRGSAAAEISDVARLSGATGVYFSCRYEPPARAQESIVYDLESSGIDVQGFDDSLLLHPHAVKTQSGAPFKVFTPFWKASLSHGEPPLPTAAPRTVRSADVDIPSAQIDELDLLPTAPDWAGGLRETWSPGEDSALTRLDTVAELAADYASHRDRPDLDATSRLSPYLHFGELSVRQFWHTLRAAAAAAPSSKGYDAMLRQLYWREFGAYLLSHFPQLPERPLREEFDHFPWSNDAQLFTAWQKGQTGYPLVDAGMRQLWHSGWMHNRVRMVVASFLVKNLMVDWQSGADWFLDTLVDADLANNSAGWQWVAGCGTDAAPYFRIFNPLRQSEKFDPDATYIRRWVPELAKLPPEFVHEPWKADPMTQQLAGVVIGKDYPLPIVDLGETRQRALDAYKQLRSLLQSPAASPGSSAG